MLNLGPGEGKGVFDAFATCPMDETTKAGDYSGDFFIHLTESHKLKGFQDQLSKLQLEYTRAHTALVDLQQGESSELEARQVEKVKKEVVLLKHKVEVLVGLEKVLRQDNKSLEEDNDVFKEKMLSLEKKILSLEEKILFHEEKILSHEEKILSHEEKILSLEATLKNMSHTTIKIWLRIALEAAHEQLTLGLGRSPPLGTTWSTFIDSVTSNEMKNVGVTTSMLHLMAHGKKSLNKTAHEAPLSAIATAVTTVQKNSDTWRSIFQFAYKEDAEQIVFDLEAEVDA